MDDGDVGALSNQIQAARTEVARHHDAALVAPALSDMMTEVDHHEARMSGILDGMNGMMGGMMSHCSGSGMTRMHEMMGAMDSEMTTHRQDMGNAMTVEDARAQCTAHTESMDGMLDNMHAGLNAMGCMNNR
jgi:hypothetical protein